MKNEATAHVKQLTENWLAKTKLCLCVAAFYSVSMCDTKIYKSQSLDNILNVWRTWEVNQYAECIVIAFKSS